MFLVAQRVVSCRDGRQGINSFLYVHDASVYGNATPRVLLEARPGHLVATSIAINPPGNRVRSYLDVVLPNEAEVSSLEVLVSTLKSQAPIDAEMPWIVSSRTAALRYLCDGEIVPVWSQEFDALYAALKALLVRRREEPVER